MNKKCGCLILMGCMAFTATGCSATTSDFESQVEKMNDVIEKDKIFDKDFQIKGKVKISDGTDFSEMSFHYEKDNKKHWIKMETYANGENEEVEIWTGEKDGSYYVFYDRDDEDIYYSYNKESDISGIFDNELDDLSVDLKETYLEAQDEFEELVKDCKNAASNQNRTCTVERSLLGTVTMTLKEETITKGKNVKIINIISLQGGKIKSITNSSSIGNYTIETTMKYSYGMQFVRLPDVDDFKKKN